MTRSRALADGTPGQLAAEYYAQRASLGLLITEGTQPSADGQGYLNTPGIYTEEHIAGWRTVTDAVHAEGGTVFMQVMHAGRVAHPDNTPHHRQPVAPSAIAAGTEMTTPTGKSYTPIPRALSTLEVKATVEDFRLAAAAAVRAGADGVEIHGANSYLIHQFLAASANERTDEYGGSIENRARFAIEVATAIAGEIGANRTGFRISPFGPGMNEAPEAAKLYRYLVAELAKLDLAYLHVFHFTDEELLGDIRSLWANPLLVIRAGRTVADLRVDLDSGLADIVPIGKLALANPDFVARYTAGADMNEPDWTTLFGGDATGYTDYPTLTTA